MMVRNRDENKGPLFFSDITDAELELQKEFSCVSDFWDANNWPYHETSPFNSEFPYGTGSIWSFMAVQTGNRECEVRVGLESNANDVNIFLLLPQYIVITAGEVMNSVTGLEFAYTQAPKSMKSVVQVGPFRSLFPFDSIF